MPQVSLYFDEATLRRVERAAHTANLSVSRYVATKIRSSLDDEWPEGYADLFGAIEDPTFVTEPVQVPDVPREPL